MTKPPDGKRSHQTIASPSQSRRRPPPKPPTWDQQKALDLASKGVGPSDIAAAVGVHRNTVRLYLQRVAPDLEAVKTFRDRLGDTLALGLAKCIDLEDKLLTALNNEDVLSTLSNGEKERLLGRVTIAKGINFDKLRLHEGKSTVNSSHRIQLEQVHNSLFQPLPVDNTRDEPTEQDEGSHQNSTP